MYYEELVSCSLCSCQVRIEYVATGDGESSMAVQTKCPHCRADTFFGITRPAWVFSARRPTDPASLPRVR